MLIKIPKGWEISENEATPETVYFSRRKFLAGGGIIGAYALTQLAGCSKISGDGPEVRPLSEWDLSPAEKGIYPAWKNETFKLDRPLTKERVAAKYNNFYEFSGEKDDVYKKVETFSVRPWEIRIDGLVEKPLTLDYDDLLRLMPMEERLYRHRCVEAWAMAVPWTGFPLKALIDRVKPLPKAKFVKFTTFKPDRRFNPTTWNAPWPYTEGLRIDEAMNPLAMMVTGIYGHPLPKQHGAPIRLVVPWKYGFKSAKSLVRIEFTDNPPLTFWNTLAPAEYGLRANVDPTVPHPRWSQETEKMIGSWKERPTLIYNGYGEFVADLYS